MESFDVPSPNGEFIATFTQLIEIAMGAPTGSPLMINGIEVQGHFSPSCLWSSDSNYLAVPQWIWGGPYHRHQNFSVYCVKKRQLFTSKKRYSVLELRSFEDDIVKGINSPKLKLPFEYRVSDLISQSGEP